MVVTGCEYQHNGDKRVYHLSDNTTVVERPRMPGKSRYHFYDPRGNLIHRAGVRVQMKQAVERHKRQWRLS